MKSLLCLLMVMSVFFLCEAKEKEIRWDGIEPLRFGCSYINNDFDSVATDEWLAHNSRKVVTNNSIVYGVINKGKNVYDYLLETVNEHYFSNVRLVQDSNEFVRYDFFDIDNDKLTFYSSSRGVSESRGDLGFCFEGSYRGRIADKLFDKKQIDKILNDGDGIYYISNDSGHITMKLVVDLGKVEGVYLYIAFD